MKSREYYLFKLNYPKPSDLALGSLKERTGSCSKNFGGLGARGEKLIKLGDSWFSAKNIEVVRPKNLILHYKVQLLGEGLALNGKN